MPSPTDPDERDALRRRLIDDESVRLVAQVGRTKIVENRLGIVAAAAGVDASNVHGRRDRPAARSIRTPRRPGCGPTFAARGLDVGVIVTDTQGRAWRLGRHRRGHRRRRGRGAGRPPRRRRRARQRTGGHPGGGRRRARRGRRPGEGQARPRCRWRWPGAVPAPEAPPTDDRRRRPGARSLIRARDEDLFRLGTDLAIEQGRREAVLLRRTVRSVHRRAGRPDGAGPVRRHRADRAGPAPHPAGPVRLGARAPDGAAGGDAGGLGGRPGRRRLVRRSGSPGAPPAARCCGTPPRSSSR